MEKIICLGKNYAEHALEMKKWESEPTSDVLLNTPSLFFKPLNAVLIMENGQVAPIAWADKRGNHYGEVHPEVEVVIEVGFLNGVPKVDKIYLGLDLTRRDLQAQLKKQGQPWELAKGFKNSALIGKKTLWKDFEKINEAEFYLKINGHLCQRGRVSDMIIGFNQILAYVTNHFELASGDFIFTGTPAGVSAATPGQEIEFGWIGQDSVCRVTLGQ